MTLSKMPWAAGGKSSFRAIGSVRPYAVAQNARKGMSFTLMREAHALPIQTMSAGRSLHLSQFQLGRSFLLQQTGRDCKATLG
jgi:hypothetical protein